MNSFLSTLQCHPRESGGPGQSLRPASWIPAFAGMTRRWSLAVFAFVGLASSAFAGPLDDALQDTLRKAYALPGAELSTSVQLDAPIADELQDFAAGARFANLVFDRTSGRFSVVVLLPTGAPAAQLAVSGLVTATAEVPVLRDMVARGQVIGQDLVDYSIVAA